MAIENPTIKRCITELRKIDRDHLYTLTSENDEELLKILNRLIKLRKDLDAEKLYHRF